MSSTLLPPTSKANTTRRARLAGPTNSEYLHSLRRLARGKITPSASAAPWGSEPSLGTHQRRVHCQLHPVHNHLQPARVGGVEHREVQVTDRHVCGHPSLCLPAHARRSTLKYKSPPPQCPRPGARSVVVATRGIFVKADVGHVVKAKTPTRTTLRSHRDSVSRQQTFQEHFFNVLSFLTRGSLMLPTPHAQFLVRTHPAPTHVVTLPCTTLCHDGKSNPMVPLNTLTEDAAPEWTVCVALQLLNDLRRHLRVSGEDHGQTVSPAQHERDTCPWRCPLRPSPMTDSHNS